MFICYYIEFLVVLYKLVVLIMYCSYIVVKIKIKYRRKDYVNLCMKFDGCKGVI